MTAKPGIKNAYKIIRTLLFTFFLTVLGIFIALFLLLSVPAVQNKIKGELEAVASDYIGSRLTAGNLQIMPFNEVVLSDVELFTPDGRRCCEIEKFGAGINLWKLILDRRIEITYAEIIGMDARIWQDREGAPLNIQFLIDAFKPKDKNKPPTKFDLKLHNIVIRKSAASFDRRWKPRAEAGRFDANHIRVTDLKADVALPRLKNDDFTVDLRRLALKERSGLEIESLHLLAHITPRQISVSDFQLRMPGSDIRPSDMSLSFNGYSKIKEALMEGIHAVSLPDAKITPSDFAPFLPLLAHFDSPFRLDADLAGNLRRVSIDRFRFYAPSGKRMIDLNARLENFDNLRNADIDIENLYVSADQEMISDVLGAIPGFDSNIGSRIAALGSITVESAGKLSLSGREASATMSVETDRGDLAILLDGGWNASNAVSADVKAVTESLDIGLILGNERLGLIAARIEAGVSGRIDSPKTLDIDANGVVPFVDFQSRRISNIEFRGEKRGMSFKGEVAVDDPSAALRVNADVSLAGGASKWNLNADVSRFETALVGLLPKYPGASFSGNLTASAVGNTPDNLTGTVELNNADIRKSADSRLPLSRLYVSSEIRENLRTISLSADNIDAEITGEFKPTGMISELRNMAAHALPSLIPFTKSSGATGGYMNLNATIRPDDALFDYFKLPVKPLQAVMIAGKWNGGDKKAEISVKSPYLLKGNDKLIKNFEFTGSLSDAEGFKGSATVNFPMKSDRATFSVGLDALADAVKADLGWIMEKNPANRGDISLTALLAKNLLSGAPEVEVNVLPSGFSLSGAEWRINPARIAYSDKSIEVSGLRIWHGLQYVDVAGKASASPLDVLAADLAGIDLEYIFNVLNINYVNFGGMATGRAMASQLFSGAPVLRVPRLEVSNFSYNDAPLGDAVIESHWDNEEKMVAINADVDDHKHSKAKIGGAIYVTRDSLSFDFDADHINVALLQPFMSGFTSSVSGEASGNIKLYGTFKDIDLAGEAFADTITLLCDQTNVRYSGSDSVFFTKGKISIPHIRIYDRYGNSAMLRGEVRHDYLHDARFAFDLTGARGLLCYDTDARSGNPWYGRIFGNGSAALRGGPGLITLDINMSTAANSTFTFELDETETAVDYTFLTFSDRRKGAAMAEMKVEKSFEEKYAKKVEEKYLGPPDIFSLNLGVSITPACTMTIVMDPRAGDKIVAHGQGAIRMAYGSDTDNFDLYGKYTLDSGDYNFSLQELILRNFKIERGSSISFNGDPMRGVLDITAAYRANTSLTDLDKSFESDPDLNRTNVPVDALLKVSGELQTPEIDFDLRLPTVTAEVERKVKSIISTEDMLNRQVIYLLVLNRFYSPEYTGSEGQGGELASVASSTLSSQLSNIIGSLTDKFTLSPQFKSERSDFSDIEVDVALSSRLFDNRLLVNGNLGYRDKSTSQSTFIGDFDLEYLLNRSGTLRLKAYNHFNDASYYLKSALTTQGLGIIYRKDFDNPFKWLRPKKKEKKEVKKGKKSEAAVKREEGPGNNENTQIKEKGSL